MRIVWVMLISMVLFSANIEELQREKTLHKTKKTKIIKQQTREMLALAILFDRKGEEESKKIAHFYQMKVISCISKNLCILSVPAPRDTPRLIREIKYRYPVINQISIHKKQHFYRY